MNRKLIMSVTFAAAAWIGAPRTAEAIVDNYSPFGTETQGAFGYVHQSNDAHYVAWFPGNQADCAHVAWYIIGPTAGLNDLVFVNGGAGPDQIFEWNNSWGDNICGYPAAAPVHNGFTVALLGGAGTDYIVSFDSKTKSWGEADGDRLVSYGDSGQIGFSGGTGYDYFCGCSTVNAHEYYLGDEDRGCAYDRSGAHDTFLDLDVDYGTCGCSC